MSDFEKVIELTDYYDGPREGVAHLDGQAHTFKSRMLDVYDAYDATDLFDLIPLGEISPIKVAHGEFRRVGSGSLPAGEWPTLEVRWTLHDESGA